MKKYYLFATAVFLAPLFAQAQSLGPLFTLAQNIGRLLSDLIPILITVALIIFFWGLVKYIKDSGEGHAQGRNIMIAGLVSLFVMVSVWGIIRLAQNALLNGNVNSPIQSPGTPVPGATPVGSNPYTGSSAGSYYPGP